MLREIVGAPLRDYPRLTFGTRRRYLRVVPAMAGIGIGALVWFVPAIPIAREGGLVPHAEGLLGMLAAFYVGALGVFLAFAPGSIDDVPDSLKGQKIQGQEATLRRLLLALFGYLAVMSLGLYVVGLVAAVAGPSLADVITGTPGLIGSSAFAAFYTFWFATIGMHTLFAVWVMGHHLPLKYPKPGPARSAHKKDDAPPP